MRAIRHRRCVEGNRVLPAIICALLVGLLVLGLSVPQQAEAKDASYKIVYKLNGGKLTGSYPKTYVHGKAVKLPTPKRTGYVFIGWYTSKKFACANAVDKISKKAMGKRVLYARWKKRILLAHRGYHEQHPQNSLAAYSAAKQKGFTWVEGDVRMTRDGVAILEHDKRVWIYVKNDSGGVKKKYVAIKSMTLKQLQSAKLVNKRPAGKNGANFATFEQWMALCGNKGLQPWIDMKAGSRAEVQKMWQTARKYGLERKCMWTSHNFRLLEYISDFDAKAPLSWHSPTFTKAQLKRVLKIEKRSHDIMVSLKYDIISAKNVATCKKHHLPLALWTLPDESTTGSYDPYLMKFDIDGLAASHYPAVV